MTDKLRAAAQATLNAWGATGGVHPRLADAFKDLRAALAEQGAEPDEIGTEWTPCVKRPITVHVRSQRPDETHVSTREGITPVKPDDLIMRGVDGEEYPIGRSLFDRTYLVGVALAEQEVEPVDDVWFEDRNGASRKSPKDCQRFGANGVPEAVLVNGNRYTRREWQSLTDEEIADAIRPCCSGWKTLEMLLKLSMDEYRAIEAALNEKNA